MKQTLQFTLDPGRIVALLAVIAGVLLGVHMVAAYAWANGDFWFLAGPNWVRYDYVAMLDLDREEGFGTWFAAITLLLAGRLLLVIARDSRLAGDGFRLWWLILAIGFHVLSVDEVAGMHEYVNAYRGDFGWIDVNWTYYAIFPLLAVFASYIPFLALMRRKGHARTVVMFVVAGALYVGGAVVVEKIGPHDQLDSLAYSLGWVTLEEGLEMAGVILFIYALLDYLRGGRHKRLVVAVAARETPVPGRVEGDGDLTAVRHYDDAAIVGP